MNFREQLHKARYGTMCNFGGGSSSQANQTSSTETTDNSIVAAPNSTNASLSHSNGNTINVTTTDEGAVSDAFQAINAISANSTTLMSNALGAVSANSTAAMQEVGSANTNALTAVNNENASALAAVSAAYSTAKAGDQKMLAFVAMAILGVVAVKVMK